MRSRCTHVQMYRGSVSLLCNSTDQCLGREACRTAYSQVRQAGAVKAGLVPARAECGGEHICYVTCSRAFTWSRATESHLASSSGGRSSPTFCAWQRMSYTDMSCIACQHACLSGGMCSLQHAAAWLRQSAAKHLDYLCAVRYQQQPPVKSCRPPDAQGFGGLLRSEPHRQLEWPTWRCRGCRQEGSGQRSWSMAFWEIMALACCLRQLRQKWCSHSPPCTCAVPAAYQPFSMVPADKQRSGCGEAGHLQHCQHCRISETGWVHVC